MTLTQKLVSCLQELKTVNLTDSTRFRVNNVKAGNALSLIYQVGLKQKSFTAEEKETLGPLIADTIDLLQINVESTANVYRTRLENSVLKKRSAIQFLIDDYSQFPVGTSTLAEKFHKVNIEESVDILDNLIEKWRHMTDSDEGSSDRESAGAKKVPESHIWWSE